MNVDSARSLLFQMKRIRFVEEEIARRYPQGRMRCPTHLSIGQEAVAAAVGLALLGDDLVVSGHRAHAHYLGKGGNLPRMIAEIYGKATGCSGGNGGSMHLIDESVGFMGSTAIVAGTVPVGVGLALASKIRRTGQIACVFMGDAVVEAGVFFEAANFAVVHKLPVLFVCENNLYSVYSPLSVRQPGGRRIHEIAHVLGLEVAHGDGNDALEVHRLASSMIDHVRQGAGPGFLEFDTYRWREHCGPNYDNDLGYRSHAEFEAWKERDPVAALERTLLRSAAIDETEIADFDVRIQCECEAAFDFAESSDFPSIDGIAMNVVSAICPPIRQHAGTIAEERTSTYGS